MALNQKFIENISYFVSNNFSLRKLTLSWSQIKSNDLLLLLESLKKVMHLQYLDLSAIPFEGHKAAELTGLITEHIKFNTSLVHLNMSYCNLDDMELMAIIMAMKKSKSLLVVHLSGNSMKSKTKDKLLGTLRSTADPKSDANYDTQKLKVRPDSTHFGTILEYEKEQQMKLELYTQNLEKKMGLAGDNKFKYETIDDRIIFYRFLGHLEIKDGQVWKLDTRCWLCDKWKYTCMIANPSASKSQFKTSEEFDASSYLQKIVMNNSDKNSEITVKSRIPKIVGEFSQWKINNMVKIDKFYDCLLRNAMPSTRQYVEKKSDYLSSISKIMNHDIFTMLRNSIGFAPYSKQTMLQMVSEERTKPKISGKNMIKGKKIRAPNTLSMGGKAFTAAPSPGKMLSKIVVPKKNANKFHKISLFKAEGFGVISSNDIQKLFKKNHPFFANPIDVIIDEHIELDRISRDNQFLSNYYVFATFMPPGDNKIIISYNDILDEDSYNLCDAIVPIRKLEVELHQKRIKKKLTIKPFQKHTSVFKDWKEDNEHILQSSFSADIGHSKLRKYIKNKDEFIQVQDLLYKYLPQLKVIFIYGIGMSSYPYMSWLEFTEL